MQNLYYCISYSLNPWENLALEELLLDTVPQGTAILYLWQNQRTVVVGRNQNAWAECNVSRLLADGGYLARRLSGGGCVYHDDQNLNFTFLVNKEDYSVEKQASVILEAVRSFGLNAEATGRNDLVIGGRKFSGNAFYERAGKCYHHGTILIHTDPDAMGRYLNVSREKLESKGVSSVKSRIVNLKDLNDAVTVEAMKTQMIKAAEKVYGLSAKPLPERWIDREERMRRTAFFSSRDWLFGRRIPFTLERTRRFEWGTVNVQVQVDKGCIREAEIFSDALDEEFIRQAAGALSGQRFEALSETGKRLPELNENRRRMLEDILGMLQS